MRACPAMLSSRVFASSRSVVYIIASTLTRKEEQSLFRYGVRPVINKINGGLQIMMTTSCNDYSSPESWISIYAEHSTVGALRWILHPSNHCTRNAVAYHTMFPLWMHADAHLPGSIHTYMPGVGCVVGYKIPCTVVKRSKRAHITLF